MRSRLGSSLVCAALCGTSLVACGGQGSSSTHLPAAVPALAAQQGPGARPGGKRRTLSVPTCSGTGTNSFIGNGFDNIADGTDSAVLDGYTNEVCDYYSSIAGGYNNAISSGQVTANYSFIGSGESNTITGDSGASVIGGGATNTIAGSSGASVIGGGDANTISGNSTSSVIAGGDGNTVSARYAAMAGGEYNTVSGKGAYVGGGGYNTASGEGAIVDGGYNDTAAGEFATIPGGYEDSAGGTESFAAGAYASAPQTGTFVWSDGSNGSTTLSSSAAYQFVARASGGVTFWTNAGATVGATLAPGSGTWASASDRNLKTEVANVDDAAVLDKVASLPISRWSYRTERGVRHVGPMAQDFYAAFKVGEDDRHITSIDEDGVALAAIKALHARVLTLDEENTQLRARLARLEAAVATLTAR